jgi:GR25 family glycosyltransferase involved in LPS biosynthesis
MRGYAIVIENHESSEKAYDELLKSFWEMKNEFTLERISAIIPSNVEEKMEEYSIRWNYPWEGQVIDIQTGLIKSAYKTKDPKKRMACAMSHFTLWVHSYQTGEDLLILEHDAKFVQKIDFDIKDTKFGILGINNPIGATRKSQLYHEKIQSNKNFFQNVPTIDEDRIPQGLAGNSAYIITPWAAGELIEKVYSYGLWPNDALMCKQIFTFIGVTRKYYTDIQKMESTTTL